MVMIVLLKEAWTWTIPSTMFFLTFLRDFCIAIDYSHYLRIALRGPLRVRPLVRVRCPRTGKPRRWRIPR